jgi:hypothetical protein
LEYGNWVVYDGFGTKILNSGIGETREDAVAIAQNWAVKFLDGKVPIMSNFRKNLNE